MLCKKCGANVLDGIKFCPNCGSSMEAPVEAPVKSNINNNMQGGYSSTPVGIETPAASVTPVATAMPTASVTPEPVVNTYSQQPVNNIQPTAMNNNGMYNNVPSNDNKNNSGLTFVIIAIVAAVIVCVGIIIYSSNKSKDDNENSNSNSNSNIVSNVNSNVVSNSNSNVVSNVTSNVVSNPTSNIVSNTTSNIVSNPTSNVVSNKPSNTTAAPANTYAVKFGGYNLYVPNSYTVSSNTTSQLQLIGTNNKDIAVANITTGDLKTMKANPSMVNTYAKQEGYTVTKGATAKTYNGVEFFVIEISRNGLPMIIAYAQMPNNKLIVFGLSSTTYQLDYSKLNLFAVTVKTATTA